MDNKLVFKTNGVSFKQCKSSWPCICTTCMRNIIISQSKHIFNNKKNKQATLLWAVLVTGGPCLLSTAVSSVLPQLESQHIFQVWEHKFRVKITLHQRGWELFLGERNSSVFWVVKSRKISRTFILSHVACAQCPWANHHDTGRAKLNKCMRQTAINTAEYHHYAF